MIERWNGDGVEAGGMDEGILTELAGVVARHPWWLARLSLTLELLRRLDVTPPARVLDAGCGWGLTLEALETQGYEASGMDVSRQALERLDRPGRRLYLADLERPFPEDLPIHDAVLALDVIEHLDDDRGAVERLGRLARPGGFVILSVPALPELFNEFDAVQGHRRRYLPKTLASVITGAGLEVERVFWWGAWMVPILKRQRRRRRAGVGDSPAEVYRKYLKLPPWPGPSLLRLAFALEQRRTLAGRLQSGTSLFAVARRPDLPSPKYSRKVE